MKYYLYSVKDSLAGVFFDIQIFQNDEVALRYFRGLCSESKIKQDLQFYKLGEYDTVTGEIVSNVDFLLGGCDCE